MTLDQLPPAACLARPVASNSRFPAAQSLLQPLDSLTVASLVPLPGWLFQVVPEEMPPLRVHSSTGRAWQDQDQVLRTRRVDLLTCAPLMLAVSIWKKERESPLVWAS